PGDGRQCRCVRCSRHLRCAPGRGITFVRSLGDGGFHGRVASVVMSSRLICPSEALVEGGPGVRCTVAQADRTLPAFAIRSAGTVYAYINQCAHVGVELDWQEGQFFDPDTGLLMCATHGALYDPASGICCEGPCRGGRLLPVPIVERNGYIELKQDD